VFREFIDAYGRDGSTDPREYLRRLDGVDREELRALIEAHLERAPRGEWDADAFAGSMAERAIAAAVPEVDSGEAEGWSELLPELREKARLKRATVVERLAAALGFPGSEDRVAAYYHRMERGQLPPSGVSTRVLEALGSILDASAERLRRAGEAGETAASAGGEVFARTGAPAEAMASPGIDATEIAGADRAEPDELDRLFTAGD
jgi:hypothetical protein